MAIKNRKTYVNQCWLNSQIDSLNTWLSVHQASTKESLLNRMKRDYYINKLIVLDESYLNFVQI